MTSFTLPSKLTKDTVMSCYRLLEQQVPADSQLTVDCHQVTQIDSAGSAWLLELKHHPRYRHVNFEQLTPPMLGLCQLYQIQL